MPNSGVLESVALSPEDNRSSKERRALPAWKRVADVSLVLLVLPLILLFALITACWVRMISPGSVLFRQTRIGRDGKPFIIYKFRSMKREAQTEVHEAHVEHLIKTDLPMIKLDATGDSRLILGGCFIRSSGLDELPQFINVLLGEMSLVGPRPCLPREYDLYDETQRQRFLVQPGLTGQWQVNRNESTTFTEMVSMDDQYVNQLSPVVDLKIILKTPLAVLEQMKACAFSKQASRSVFLRSFPARPSRMASPSLFSLPISATQELPD
jgi:lipopolysaccharide/colanic/teichoic acid biosynthesis glycosyltransferase